MTTSPGRELIRTTKGYDALLKSLYAGAKRKAQEVDVPPVQALSVTGNEPPGGKQYQVAVGVLYGVGYTLKMGLKFGRLPRPAGYFDYKVGALETLWWSTGKDLDLKDPKTLRWQAYLMVPPFVTRALVADARRMAREKSPEVAFETATLETMDEGRSVQILHVGPYANEPATIAELHAYVAAHRLVVAGRHHEIYVSDPRRTAPGKLKTVIRYPVRPA